MRSRRISSLASGWRALTRSRTGATGALAIALLAFLPPLTFGAPQPAVTPLHLPPPPPPVGPGAIVPIATLLDNQQVSVTVATLHAIISDSTEPVTVSASQRSYSITVQAALPLRTVYVNLTTNPLTQWADPSQIPGGPDVLPPLANWTWQVFVGRINDTSNWTALPLTSQLSRITPCLNQTYVVVGTMHFSVAIRVNPLQLDGTQAPALGLVLHSPNYRTQFPPNDPDFSKMVSNLTPRLLRWSQIQVNPGVWNNSTGIPAFNFTPVAALIAFAHSLGAQTMVDLPVGTWGDGNVLPVGMPLNTSVALTSKSGGSGYFPTLTAYRSFVSSFASALAKAGLYIDYWNIGNEVPAGSNTSLALAFSPLFNAASAAIHRVFPLTLIGSDIMTHPWLISTFAQYATGVGFLEFHFYPADGGCPVNTTFCPPNDQNTYLTDPAILTHSAAFAHGANFFAPRTSQWMWYNVTHHWLPVFDTESNLNAYLGYGTDPRQQTLFGASWMVSQMMDAAQAGLSSVAFFALQGPYSAPGTVTFPYGGWGYSLTSEGTSDNDTKYAPYWGLDMWGSSIPAGTSGLVVDSSSPNLVRGYAVASPNGLNLVLACRTAAVTTVSLRVLGHALTSYNYSILDATTYRMAYNASLGTTLLTLSGVATRGLGIASTGSVVFDGYGVAVVRLVFVGVHPAAPLEWNQAGATGPLSGSTGSWPIPGPSELFGAGSPAVETLITPARLAVPAPSAVPQIRENWLFRLP